LGRNIGAEFEQIKNAVSTTKKNVIFYLTSMG